MLNEVYIIQMVFNSSLFIHFLNVIIILSITGSQAAMLLESNSPMGSMKSEFSESTRPFISSSVSFNMGLDESFGDEAPLKVESEATASRKIIPIGLPLKRHLSFGHTSSNIDKLRVQDSSDLLLDSPLSSAPGSPNKGSNAMFFSPARKSLVQIGTSWSVAIQCFKQSGSMFECIGHIRHLVEVLSQIAKQDRIRYCKADFINAVNFVRKNCKNKFVLNDELIMEVNRVMTMFFDENKINRLPQDLLYLVFSQLGIDEFSVYSSTCKTWNELASRDEVWRGHYHHRFTRSNPAFKPPAMRNFKEMYRTRLVDPELGDKVEVAWRGKFRLEARDVYQGLAWWVAEVVDKHTSQGKYKIHYPGWESRWDEWVPRTRLRWAVEANTICQLNAGDVVELWCCGANVPGAWLESRVKKVRDGRYCVNRVLTTGATTQSRPLWAERSRLRLVRHPHDPDNLKSCSSGSEEYDANGAVGVRQRNRLGQLFSYVGNFLTNGIVGSNPNVRNETASANVEVGEIDGDDDPDQMDV